MNSSSDLPEFAQLRILTGIGSDSQYSDSLARLITLVSESGSSYTSSPHVVAKRLIL